jgi:hypothetical protein
VSAVSGVASAAVPVARRMLRCTSLIELMNWSPAGVSRVAASARSSAWETRNAVLRSTSRRPSDRTRVSVAKKSIVPRTSPRTSSGRQTPDLTPARCAAGARTQSLT